MMRSKKKVLFGFFFFKACEECCQFALCKAGSCLHHPSSTIVGMLNVITLEEFPQGGFQVGPEKAHRKTCLAFVEFSRTGSSIP